MGIWSNENIPGKNSMANKSLVWLYTTVYDSLKTVQRRKKKKKEEWLEKNITFYTNFRTTLSTISLITSAKPERLRKTVD